LDGSAAKADKPSQACRRGGGARAGGRESQRAAAGAGLRGARRHRLHHHPHAPFTAIAKQLGISEGAVRNRVGQLIESKVLRIIGVADPMALGYDAYAMIGLKLEPGHDPQKAAHYFRDLDGVTYVLFVAGRYDLLVEVICETHDQLALFLREHCYSRKDLASVEPMVGLAMYKNMLKWGQP
jgi:Lrp/AsnC family transcriptional regulator for asnA, asnC and gidA